jgi:Uma2 family endonuclease
MAETAPVFETVADVLRHLDDIPPERICLDPAPGKATEEDLLARNERSNRLYELVDGVLVEKVMGLTESCLAQYLGRLMGNFVEAHDLGVLAGADGPFRLLGRLVRLPDIAFISWDQLPQRGVFPAVRIGDLAPALAVEVLSEGNTSQEMQRKRREYFLSGVQVVWIVDPANRKVTVYSVPDQESELSENDTLDGGEILPGFELPLRDLFARVSVAPTPGKRKKMKSKGKKGRGKRKT